MNKQQSLFSKLGDKLSSALKPESNSEARKHKPLTSRRKQGNKAEDLALQYLIKQGFRLVERNFTTKLGEVDLIMKDGDNLVFIEVRYRKNADYGGAAESVTPKKQQRIIKAALAYHQKHAPHSCMRFDVVAIEGIDKKLNHIINAFGSY